MDKTQLINHYFEKTLTDEERLVFENYLENDEDFANEVTFEENLKKAIILNERSTLKQKLKSFENEKQSKKPMQFWYVAASFLLIFGCSFWFLNQSSNTEKLYSDYYQTYPNTIFPTVRGNQKEDLKSQAFSAYDNESYEQSAYLFSIIYTKNKEDFALFYEVISLMEINKHKEAVVILEQYNIHKKNQFSPLISWYKALCYIKLNEKKKAKLLLKSLTSYQNSQQELAKNLLSKLD